MASSEELQGDATASSIARAKERLVERVRMLHYLLVFDAWRELLASPSGEMLQEGLASGIRVGSEWGPAGTRLGACWDPSGIPPGSEWDPSGIRVGSDWGPSGIRVGSD